MTHPLLFDPNHSRAAGELFEDFAMEPSLAASRTRLEEIWQRFAPYADAHFVDEFRRDLFPRYWELFLFDLFIQAGYSVLPHPPRGPDLKLRLPNDRLLWVEAVAPGPGEGADAVRPIEGGGFVPSDQIVLRLRSAIHDKILKLKAYAQSGIIGPTDLVLLAVNPGKTRFTMMDAEPSFALQCVYPLGAPYVAFDAATGAATREGFSHRPSIEKQSDAQVSTAVFIDPDNSLVSGMLYSSLLPYYLGAVTPPYAKLCRLVHSGVAANPVKGVLDVEGEAMAIQNNDNWNLTWTW
jgi:hypothetical protein